MSHRLGMGAGLLLLSLMHFLIVADRAREATPTLDEVAHLPAGIAVLERRTFRLYPHNPPLARVLAALPSRAVPPRMHYQGTWARHDPPNHWLFAFGFLEANAETAADQERYLQAFDRGRLVVALWSALSIPVLWAWGRWWFGPWAGWLAAILWCICPNLIAHAGLVTTDLAAASNGLLATWLFARWLDRPGWIRALLWATALGAAELVKFSSLWLYLILPAWAILHVLSTAVWRPARWTQFVAAMAISILCIDAGYLVEGVGTPLGKFPFVSETLTRPRTPADAPPEVGSNATYNFIHRSRINRFRGTWLGALPCPLPYYYVSGFDEQKFEAESKYQMYLRGQFAPEAGPSGGRRGWWYYYLYCLALKVPIGTWLLIVMGAAGGVYWRDVDFRRWLGIAALAAVPIASMSLLTDINLGLRYVLPAIPYLLLLAGTAVQRGRPVTWNLIALALVAWNGVEVARIHPHELSYFNEVAGSSSDWRWHLIDSNLDWGEDLRRLAQWLDRHPDWKESVRLAYMGTVPPEWEGVHPYELAPRDLRYVPPEFRLPWENPEDPWSYGPQPGKFAVSANFERGMFLHTPCPRNRLAAVLTESPRALLGGSTMIRVPKNAYSYFQHFSPRIEPEIGYSILLFDITRDEANRVRREMGMPQLPEVKDGAPWPAR